MRYQQTFGGFVLLILMVVLAGCFSAKPQDIEAFLRPDEAQVTADDYLMQPPESVTPRLSAPTAVSLLKTSVRSMLPARHLARLLK